MSGFTIFEIMVVVTIAAITAAFAIPEFQTMMARNRVSATADEMATALSSARNTAITRRRTVIMQDVAGDWETRLDNDTTGLKLGRQEIKAPVMATFWQGSDETNDVDQITFAPSGLVTKTKPGTAEALSLTIRFCDSGSPREIGRDVTVSRIGRIVVKKHASPAICNP